MAVPQLRLLLAEDIPDHQQLLAHILRSHGHSVDVAEDGQQAVCMAQGNRYDAILMDVKMPGLNGLDATRAIRATGNRVPIVALTAYAMTSDRERCLAAGMDGYIPKPIKANEMLSLVESLVAGCRL